jgi:hypothetical protein
MLFEQIISKYGSRLPDEIGLWRTQEQRLNLAITEIVFAEGELAVGPQLAKRQLAFGSEDRDWYLMPTGPDSSVRHVLLPKCDFGDAIIEVFRNRPFAEYQDFERLKEAIMNLQGRASRLSPAAAGPAPIMEKVPYRFDEVWPYHSPHNGMRLNLGFRKLGQKGVESWTLGVTEHALATKLRSVENG